MIDEPYITYKLSVSDYWETYKRVWCNCKLCPLSMCRNSVVLFRGQLPCQVLFIGEAPGRSEDDLGVPFVGEAGHLLQTIISDSRQKSFPYRYGITNVVACLPLKDGELRAPTIEEIALCSRRLKQLIEIANPQLIVAVGKVALLSLPNSFLPKNLSTNMIAIAHPSWILQYGTSMSCLEAIRIIADKVRIHIQDKKK